jgi:hypothetical protein
MQSVRRLFFHCDIDSRESGKSGGTLACNKVGGNDTPQHPQSEGCSARDLEPMSVPPRCGRETQS